MINILQSTQYLNVLNEREVLEINYLFRKIEIVYKKDKIDNYLVIESSINPFPSAKCCFEFTIEPIQDVIRDGTTFIKETHPQLKGIAYIQSIMYSTDFYDGNEQCERIDIFAKDKKEEEYKYTLEFNIDYIDENRYLDIISQRIENK